MSMEKFNLTASVIEVFLDLSTNRKLFIDIGDVQDKSTESTDLTQVRGFLRGEADALLAKKTITYHFVF